jgi:hypothetical protein
MLKGDAIIPWVRNLVDDSTVSNILRDPLGKRHTGTRFTPVVESTVSARNLRGLLPHHPAGKLMPLKASVGRCSKLRWDGRPDFLLHPSQVRLDKSTVAAYVPWNSLDVNSLTWAQRPQRLSHARLPDPPECPNRGHAQGKEQA